jgi:hypothetical protein
MLLEDVASYLQSNSIGTAGSDIYLNITPELPNLVVVVNEYMSTEPKATMNGKNAPLLESPRIQIMVRDDPKEVVGCYNRARAVYVLMCKLVDTVMGGKVCTFEPLDTPTMTGRDPQERVLYTMNFQVTVQP